MAVEYTLLNLLLEETNCGREDLYPFVSKTT